MKILQITNELSKKNFSIASLIVFISSHMHKSYGFDYSILTSKIDKNLFEDRNINKIDLVKWLGIFFCLKKLIKQISNSDVIHIHGIWAPIQIFSILVCNFKNKNYAIHPHGMLLNEALKSAGFLRLIYKKIFLFIFKFFISRKVCFVSITNQENDAIKNFFPKSKVNNIYNPIPFNKQKLQITKKKKQFVYFGRIHPHKNIDLVIKAFKNAKLGEDWSLKIYGIHDDNKYLDFLTKLIGSETRIQILEPIFDKEKQIVLNESWMNVLLSKSEVLSLSILEASIHGLPSLANKSIEINQIKDSIITSGASVSEIKDKFELASRWTEEERLIIGRGIFKNVEKITSINQISNKYINLYNNFETEKNISEISGKNLFSLSNIKFLFITGTFMFNLMFSSFIIVTLVSFGHYSVAGELGLIISFWITITQIFSSNMRSIIISENKIEYAFNALFYRICISIIFYLFVYFFILDFFLFENKNLINLFSLLILVQWINEMSLVKSEVKKKIFIFKIYSLVNTLILFLSIISVYLSYFDILGILIFSYISFMFFSITLNFYKFYQASHNLNLKMIYQLNIRTIAFLSSFSIVISSFVWRVMIYLTFDKSLAGLFFACFSIGSFPGTLFNSVVGPAFIKQKIQLSKNLLYLLSVIFILILTWFMFNYNFIFNDEKINYLSFEFTSFTISISLIGSYFMCYAMYKRHKKIQSSIKTRSDLFQTDIIYGITITFVIPILYYFGNIIGVSFAFFISSLVALTVYSFSDKFQLYDN